MFLSKDLRSVSTTRVLGPSSRAENSARELGCIFDTRQLGPSSRVVETGRPCTRPVQVDIDQSQVFIDSLLHCYVYCLHFLTTADS